MSKTMSGAHAKRAREAGKLSQAAVAAAVGLNRTYYSLFEAGRMTLTADQQSKLADFLCEHDTSVLSGTKAVETSSSLISSTSATVEARPPSTAQSQRPRYSQRQMAIKRLAALEQIIATGQPTGYGVAAAIKRVLNSLGTLDHNELSALAEARGIVLEEMPISDDYETLSESKRQQVKTDLQHIITCHAIYGNGWLTCNRNDLYQIVCDLRLAFPDAGKIIPFPSVLEEMFESSVDASKTTLRLRIEAAPYLLKCAMDQLPIVIPD